MEKNLDAIIDDVGEFQAKEKEVTKTYLETILAEREMDESNLAYVAGVFRDGFRAALTTK